MTFSEFEYTINRICTMTELIVYKELKPTIYDLPSAASDQRNARDEVVRIFINWAKKKATL
jgi:hypothetical protein